MLGKQGLEKAIREFYTHGNNYLLVSPKFILDADAATFSTGHPASVSDVHELEQIWRIAQGIAVRVYVVDGSRFDFTSPHIKQYLARIGYTVYASGYPDTWFRTNTVLTQRIGSTSSGVPAFIPSSVGNFIRESFYRHVIKSGKRVISLGDELESVHTSSQFDEDSVLHIGRNVTLTANLTGWQLEAPVLEISDFSQLAEISKEPYAAVAVLLARVYGYTTIIDAYAGTGRDSLIMREYADVVSYETNETRHATLARNLEFLPSFKFTVRPIHGRMPTKPDYPVYADPPWEYMYWELIRLREVEHPVFFKHRKDFLPALQLLPPGTYGDFETPSGLSASHFGNVVVVGEFSALAQEVLSTRKHLILVGSTTGQFSTIKSASFDFLRVLRKSGFQYEIAGVEYSYPARPLTIVMPPGSGKSTLGREFGFLDPDYTLASSVALQNARRDADWETFNDGIREGAGRHALSTVWVPIQVPAGRTTLHLTWSRKVLIRKLEYIASAGRISGHLAARSSNENLVFVDSFTELRAHVLKVILEEDGIVHEFPSTSSTYDFQPQVPLIPWRWGNVQHVFAKAAITGWGLSIPAMTVEELLLDKKRRDARRIVEDDLLSVPFKGRVPYAAFSISNVSNPYDATIRRIEEIVEAGGVAIVPSSRTAHLFEKVEGGIMFQSVSNHNFRDWVYDPEIFIGMGYYVSRPVDFAFAVGADSDHPFTPRGKTNAIWMAVYGRKCADMSVQDTRTSETHRVKFVPTHLRDALSQPSIMYYLERRKVLESYGGAGDIPANEGRVSGYFVLISDDLTLSYYFVSVAGHAVSALLLAALEGFNVVALVEQIEGNLFHRRSDGLPNPESDDGIWHSPVEWYLGAVVAEKLISREGLSPVPNSIALFKERMRAVSRSSYNRMSTSALAYANEVGPPDVGTLPADRRKLKRVNRSLSFSVEDMLARLGRRTLD
jgi:hypothetical protein